MDSEDRNMNFYKKQDCQIESFLTRGGTKLWIIWLLIGIAWLIVNALTLQWWTLRWQDESQLLEIGRVVSLPESPYFNTYLAGRRLFSNGALAMYLLHSKFGWLGMRFALLLFQLAAATLFLWWGLLQKIRETMAVGLAVLLLLEPYGLLMTRAARLEPMILCALFGCLLLLQMSRNGKGAWSVPPCRLPLFGAGFLFFIMFSVWFRSVLYFPLVGMFLLEFLFQIGRASCRERV